MLYVRGSYHTSITVCCNIGFVSSYLTPNSVSFLMSILKLVLVCGQQIYEGNSTLFGRVFTISVLSVYWKNERNETSIKCFLQDNIDLLNVTIIISLKPKRVGMTFGAHKSWGISWQILVAAAPLYKFLFLFIIQGLLTIERDKVVLNDEFYS